MRKYLYVKDIDRDILKNLFNYNKYKSNPRLSDLEDFRLPNKLDWFFRTGKLPKDNESMKKGTCSLYIDISKVNLNDDDREFLCNISHVAIEDRFKNTNYHKVDLLSKIPINGFKKALYCCISFAKKYPNTAISLTSKHNQCIKLIFRYTEKDGMIFAISDYHTNDVNCYIHGKDDISKFEEEVLKYYESYFANN